MTETFDIAGYARISVDDELDQKNISIENQKAIIEDYVHQNFPGSSLTFFEDRDRSGYTFDQREGYQEMRRGLMSHKYDILIIKDFSRFSRRNSRGLVELEDLSHGMRRTEVRSRAGDSHLGHVFTGDPESPNGVRYCINSAALRFVPYEKMEAEGYGYLLYLFEK